ncbi:triosephosphate isomerase [Apophysomyces sp. BC1015]|nr:triosephosphate isomerase [Apophysomyces sp. BC1015]
MVRNFFVGGNWKMNGSVAQVKSLVEQLNNTAIPSGTEVVVSPPAIYVDRVRQALKKEIGVAAQNSYVKPSGAYTGEIRTSTLTGSSSVTLSVFVGEKTAHALKAGVKVIACIGEKLEERETEKTTEVVTRQLKGIADQIQDWTNVVVAYEPVWAIGTGKVATPEQAEEVHANLRQWLSANVSKEVADQVRIIYGGSVNGGNAAELAKKENIDGFLVGGASLKPEFSTIVAARQ